MYLNNFKPHEAQESKSVVGLEILNKHDIYLNS